MPAEPSLNIEDLRRVAEAATPGPWRTIFSGGYETLVRTTDNAINIASAAMQAWSLKNPHQDARNALHIATFDPPTVLSLLDCISSVEAELAKARTEEEEADRSCVQEFERAQASEARGLSLEAENSRLREALETFAILANEDTAYLSDEHVITLSYDDTDLDPDLGGPNTVLGERFMRAFRRASQALAEIEGRAMERPS